MRTLLLFDTTLVTLVVLGQICWAEDFSKQPSPLQSLSVVQLDPYPSTDSHAPFPALLSQVHSLLTLKTSYMAPLNKPTRLKDLRPEAEEHRTQSVLAVSSLFQGTLLGEGELAYTPSDPQSVEGRGNTQSGLLRLRLSGTQGGLRYGITYRTAGKYFVNLPDQATREVWGEWGVGVARIRSSLTETWNNVDKDPTQSRLTQTQERVSLAITPLGWPEFSLAFARSSIASSLEPQGVLPQRNQVDTVEGALSYTSATWTTKLSSLYSLNNDRLRAGAETVGLTHALSGSYRPTTSLMIAPSLSWREDWQRWSGVQINTASASLSLSYTPSTVFNLTTVGSWSQAHSSDRLVNGSTYNAKSVYTWTYQTGPVRRSLSFEAGYAHSVDVINRALSTEDLSGLLRLQVAGF